MLNSALGVCPGAPRDFPARETANAKWKVELFPAPAPFRLPGDNLRKKARSFVRLSDVTKLQAIAVNFTSQEDREAPDVLGS